MAETKKTEAAAAAAPPEAACLTLRQKLVEMRKACPEIVKKQHSDGVSYKYAKIYDVWEKITPIMNELGVDFDVISEQATRHAENGDPVYWITMQTKTRNGDKLMFLYEADLTIRWLNLDNDDETIEATVHAVGWNDDPAKAKGAAHTYVSGYATGGFTSGPSIAGEDPRYPTEAVISFNPAYRSQNLSYWAEAGRMLGASSEADYEPISSGSGTAVVYDLSGLSFSPQIKVEGDTDEDALIRKLRDLEPEFIDFILEALSRREGGAYVTADSRLY